jgi:hypothetical protein
VDKFLYQCANMTWGTHGIKSPPLSILCTFYRQKVSVGLQRVQVFSILRHVVVVGEVSLRLGILLRGPPLSVFDIVATPL